MSDRDGRKTTAPSPGAQALVPTATVRPSTTGEPRLMCQPGGRRCPERSLLRRQHQCLDRVQLPGSPLKVLLLHPRRRSCVRFWERNGSGGTLSSGARSGHRARLDSSDVQERRLTAALPGCALSSHRGGQGSCQLRLRQAKLTFKLSSLVLRACHSHAC